MRSAEKKSPAPRGRREASWEDLIRCYGPLVRGQVHRSLRGAGFVRPEPEQVDERVQEVYCRLLSGGSRRLCLLRRWSEGQVVSYLSRVAQGVVLDELRSQAAVKRGGGFPAALDGRLREIADHAVDPRGTPEDEVLLREGRRVVLTRCRSLLDPNLCQEDRQRSLRILRRALLDGWTGEEIVRAEGGRLAASTIHALVHRVRRRLVSPSWQTAGALGGARYHPNP
jgi:DNA-directed RNA polymerase specialized sigma24 family protein